MLMIGCVILLWHCAFHIIILHVNKENLEKSEFDEGY